jgi:hypothetical protein
MLCVELQASSFTERFTVFMGVLTDTAGLQGWKQRRRAIIFRSSAKKQIQICNTFKISFIASGVELSPLYCGHFWPIVPAQMIGEGDCGAIGGMKIGRGNRSTWRKPAPAPLCPPQIPLDQTRYRNGAAAVGRQRLTAWAVSRPYLQVTLIMCYY